MQDLATRNVLLDRRHRCCVADFGLARTVDPLNGLVEGNGRFPVEPVHKRLIRADQVATA